MYIWAWQYFVKQYILRHFGVFIVYFECIAHLFSVSVVRFEQCLLWKCSIWPETISRVSIFEIFFGVNQHFLTVVLCSTSMMLQLLFFVIFFFLSFDWKKDIFRFFCSFSPHWQDRNGYKIFFVFSNSWHIFLPNN